MATVVQPLSLERGKALGSFRFLLVITGFVSLLENFAWIWQPGGTSTHLCLFQISHVLPLRIVILLIDPSRLFAVSVCRTERFLKNPFMHYSRGHSGSFNYLIKKFPCIAYTVYCHQCYVTSSILLHLGFVLSICKRTKKLLDTEIHFVREETSSLIQLAGRIRARLLPGREICNEHLSSFCASWSKLQLNANDVS